MKDTMPSRAPRGTRWCSTGIALTLVGLLVLLASGPGHRLGLLATRPALLVYLAGIFILILAVAGNGTGLLLSRGSAGRASATGSWISLAAGIVIVASAAVQISAARTLPPIHDITTDTENPPQFVAVLPLRANAPNPPEYTGGEVADLQRDAYPDIGTIELSRSADTVFDDAVRIVEELGWKLVAAEAGEGRIEATDTTPWFGFKDDIVIRIEGSGDTTRVDVRSKSRVGMSDLGKNASRIRHFRDRLGGG